MAIYVNGKPAGSGGEKRGADQGIVITGIRIDTLDVVRLCLQITGVMVAISAVLGVVAAVIHTALF